MDVIGLAFTRFVDVPVVLTNHHPHEPVLSAIYERYPRVEYVAISDAQARREPMPQITVVHHGLRLDDYIFKDAKKATWRSSAGWSRVGRACRDRRRPTRGPPAEVGGRGAADVRAVLARRRQPPAVRLSCRFEVAVCEGSPIIPRREARPAVSARVGCVDSARG